MKPTFFSSFLVLGPTSGTSSRDLTLYYRHTSLFAQREGFFISCFPFFILYPTFLFSIDFLSALHSPHPLHSLPHFLFLSSPLFHLPPQLTHECAHPRALRAYAYTHPYPHVRRFSFFSITASPTLRNLLCTNALGVKENEKKPSPNTQPPHNQNIDTKHPISSTMNSIYHRGEPIYHHREHKNKKPSPLTHCAITICGIPVKR